jgi:4-aminobutyrate aminotransferase/(S)-3-amino-2-methylpropionate transaminase
MRDPFRAQLNQCVTFAPYPLRGRDDLAERAILEARTAFARGDIGALVIEPILGRGGVATANGTAVDALVELAHEHDAIVIADEIYTGLRRVDGESWFATSKLWGESPDIVCLGKALGGTMPISACLVRGEIAAAWGDPDKEVIHTSTFLGNPLACEAALATLQVLDDDGTCTTLRTTAAGLWSRVLHPLTEARGLGVRRVDGAGLLFGIVLEGGIARALGVVRKLLERGYIALPGGNAELGATVTFTPPMTLDDAQIAHFGETLRTALDEVSV